MHVLLYGRQYPTTKTPNHNRVDFPLNIYVPYDCDEEPCCYPSQNTQPNKCLEGKIEEVGC